MECSVDAVTDAARYSSAPLNASTMAVATRPDPPRLDGKALSGFPAQVLPFAIFDHL